jgi:hypothetical protein
MLRKFINILGGIGLFFEIAMIYIMADNIDAAVAWLACFAWTGIALFRNNQA